ncbi:APC family permease [Deinococcus sp. Arct2-2]|uniref:APC family permease n=1 Tax=Deinococcus sp. Arct2-2 TaxID=2568653 RepID=UPI001454BB6B|nr:APC family permease [Deinococcus sp. Arct2-2]
MGVPDSASPPPLRNARTPTSPFLRWFLDTGQPEKEGFYEEEGAVKSQEHTHPWWKVMCLTGVDYFSTLGYQPGIAALAAGALSPVATLVLVLVTLFGALPMYRRVAAESPHGDGSISMLERLLAYWPSKLLVLALIGFVATGFVITITLSAADGAAHLIENPLLKEALEGKQVPITLTLIALLGAVFLKGFKEAIGIAVGIVILYIGLSAVVIGRGLLDVVAAPQVIGDWWQALTTTYLSPLALIGAALLVFPRLALGLSGFETGVVVMPLVRGAAGDTEAKPAGRIRNTQTLLTTAALIMSVMLIGSALVTTFLIPRAQFWPAITVTRNVNAADLNAGRAVFNMPLDDPAQPNEVHSLPLVAGKTGTYRVDAQTAGGVVPMTVTVRPTAASGTEQVTVVKPAGEANGRALAYLAHKRLGEGFGTLYDVSTILILWFAGASAMAGLLNIVPRYLPRYGMAPDWARATRPLAVVFTLTSALVTILFKANVDAQAGAYATGVLALMTSAAIAVFLTELRRKHRWPAAAFALVSVLFIYTSAVTVISRPEGLYIALMFIGAILVFSVASRVSRSTELRVNSITVDDTAHLIMGSTKGRPLRLIANALDAGDTDEYREKELEVRADTHLPGRDTATFLEVQIRDASSFSDDLQVTGHHVGPYQILRLKGASSVPNAIAAFLLFVRDETGVPPHVYFEWDEDSPIRNALRFLIAGEGDIPPLTHEILRQAEPERKRRPVVHAGG